MVTIRQIPTDTSLTASTNVISMQYPNTILNTKMTLPQLVGPILPVTEVTNSKLLPQRMPALNSPKQNMHAPPKQNSHTVPLHLVHPNMHKARSFPRSPAKNTGYFHKLIAPARIPEITQSSLHGMTLTLTLGSKHRQSRVATKVVEKNAHAEHDSPAKGCHNLS